MNGKMTRLLEDKGFGFITGEDGQDYVFHRRALEGEFTERPSHSTPRRDRKALALRP